MPRAFIPTDLSQIPAPPVLLRPIPPVPVHRIVDKNSNESDSALKLFKKSTSLNRHVGSGVKNPDDLSDNVFKRQRSTILMDNKKASMNELKIGSNLLVKPKLKVAGNVP